MGRPGHPRADLYRSLPHWRWGVVLAAGLVACFYAIGRLTEPRPELPDRGLLFVLALGAGGVAGLMLHHALYRGTDLEHLLTAPVTQTWIFFRKWSGIAFGLGAIGALATIGTVACLSGAGHSGVDVAAAALDLMAVAVFAAALAAFLGPLPQVFNLLLMTAIVVWVFVDPSNPAIDWIARSHEPPAWATVTTALSLALMLLAVAGLRLTFRPESLVRSFERRGAPDTAAGRHAGESWPTRRYRRLLSRRARALLQLASYDDAPENLPSRVPWLLALFGLGWAAATVLASLPWSAEMRTDDKLWLFMGFYGFFFFCSGVPGLLLLLAPSRSVRSLLARGRASGLSDIEALPWPEPYQEIWPVDVRELLDLSLAHYWGAATLFYLCLLPFALMTPIPTATVLEILGVPWLGILLLSGLFVQTRLFLFADPRREPPRPLSRRAQLLIGLSCGWIIIEVAYRFATDGWTPWSTWLVEAWSWLVAPVSWFWELTPVGFVAVLLGLEWCYLPLLLRRYRRRWFDAVVDVEW